MYLKLKICAPKYSIKDAQGNVALIIEGPICTTTICGSDVEFEVMSPDGQSNVGKISKQCTVMRFAYF